MYKTLNFSTQNGRNVFFTSDSHISHNKEFIFGPRGFSDVKSHDETLELIWNAKVGHNDTVLMLGDIIFGQNADVRLLELFTRLNFKELYLSGGNHTSGFRQLYQDAKNRIFNLPPEAEVYPLRVNLGKTWNLDPNKTVIFMPNLYEIFVNNQHIVCSHYALAVWNGNGHGSIMLCGHSHSRYVPSRPEVLDQGKILDVGIDCFPAPVSFDEVMRVMDKKPIKEVDHHGANTNYAI